MRKRTGTSNSETRGEGFKDPEMSTETKELVFPMRLPHSHGILGFRGGAAVCTKEDPCVRDGGGELGLLHGVNNEGCLLAWRLQHLLTRCLETEWAFGITTMTRDGR